MGEFAGKTYTRDITYDGAGRPTSTSPEIPGVLAEQKPSVTYNRFGTPITMEIINHPGAGQTSTKVVNGIVQDELGRLTDRVYANGVVRSIAYDEQFSAPSSIQAWYVNSGGATKYLQDDEFTRDGFGRVTEILDGSDTATAIKETQCFVYDGHNRLSQAWTLSTASPFEDDCGDGLPGTGSAAWAASAAPYATSWDYSESGKIKSITNLIADAVPFEQTQAMSYGVVQTHEGLPDTLAVAHAVTASETKVGVDDVELWCVRV